MKLYCLYKKTNKVKIYMIYNNDDKIYLKQYTSFFPNKNRQNTEKSTSKQVWNNNNVVILYFLNGKQQGTNRKEYYNTIQNGEMM
jgi:hypothetical protein